MTFKVGDRVFTRDGREEEVLRVDAPYPYPLISMDVLTGLVTRRYADGRIFHDQDHEKNDLLPKAKPSEAACLPTHPKRTREVVVYVNIYSDGEEFHKGKREAEICAGFTALAVAVPHTFTIEY